MPHLWPTGSSWGRPLDYGPVLLRKPFGPHLTVGALSSAVPSWRLQVHLGCVQLSPACPFRYLHTCHLRPARHYPRLWIRPPSSGGRRDFNPPDQCAAWRTVPASPPPCPARPCPHGSSVGACRTTGRASRVALIPLFQACRRHYPGGAGRCRRRSLPGPCQPSSSVGRVGFRIDCFEACSAFAHATARLVAEPPSATLLHRSASADVVASIVRSDCYRLERWGGRLPRTASQCAKVDVP